MRRIRKRPGGLHLLVAAVVLAGFALVGAGAAVAKTVAVNCAADPNALATALADPSLKNKTTLAIAGTCNGTFEIGKSLTLAGSGSGGATLDGQGAGPVVTVDAGQTVDISKLVITGGSSTASACGTSAVGGIHNSGTLTLTQSSVSGNSAASSAPTNFTGAVGGICNDVGGTLTLTQSTVSGNSASVVQGFAFGGILSGGTMTITGSSVSGNSATATGSSGIRVARAGIENTGTLTITGSSVSGNSASAPTNASGGILNGVNQDVSGSGTLTITGSSVSGNSASSANGSAVSGIANNNSGNVGITKSTVSGNSASAPTGIAVGGISNQAPATITLTNMPLKVVNNTPINCNFSDPACAIP